MCCAGGDGDCLGRANRSAIAAAGAGGRIEARPSAAKREGKADGAGQAGIPAGHAGDAAEGEAGWADRRRVRCGLDAIGAKQEAAAERGW